MQLPSSSHLSINDKLEREEQQLSTKQEHLLSDISTSTSFPSNDMDFQKNRNPLNEKLPPQVEVPSSPIVSSLHDSIQPPRPSVFQRILRSLSNFEHVWQVLCVCSILIGSILVHWIHRFHSDPTTAMIKKNSISYFLLGSMVVAAIIAFIRQMLKPTLDRLMLRNLVERKKSSEYSLRRSQQMAKWVIDIFYYAMSTTAGIAILYPSEYLPSCMFGKGICGNMFYGYPNIVDVQYLDYYYVIQAGQHLYSLVEQLLHKRDEKKFYEFALHHSVTLILIFFSYFMNFLIVGVLVFIIHDLSDCALLAIRIYGDLKQRKASLEIGLITISFSVWAYLRNIILPFCIIKTCIQESQQFVGTPLHDIIFPPGIFMIAMLTLLAFLHVYWSFFFVHAVISSLTQSKYKKSTAEAAVAEHNKDQ